MAMLQRGRSDVRLSATIRFAKSQHVHYTVTYYYAYRNYYCIHGIRVLTVDISIFVFRNSIAFRTRLPGGKRKTATYGCWLRTHTRSPHRNHLDLDRAEFQYRWLLQFIIICLCCTSAATMVNR